MQQGASVGATRALLVPVWGRSCLCPLLGTNGQPPRYSRDCDRQRAAAEDASTAMRDDITALGIMRMFPEPTTSSPLRPATPASQTFANALARANQARATL